MYFIYALVCPITNKVRYVGKTTQPQKRFNEHASGRKGERGKWVSWLKKQGLCPKFKILKLLYNEKTAITQEYVFIRKHEKNILYNRNCQCRKYSFSPMREHFLIRKNRNQC